MILLLFIHFSLMVFNPLQMVWWILEQLKLSIVRVKLLHSVEMSIPVVE